jgi:hypothetical protein
MHLSGIKAEIFEVTCSKVNNPIFPTKQQAIHFQNIPYLLI